MIRSFFMLCLLLAITAALIRCSWGSTLAWDANPEPVATYRVWRMEGTERSLVLETPSTEASFPARAGQVYAVTAISPSGEESALSTTVTIPAYTVEVSSEELPEYRKELATDGDSQTFWHTTWRAAPPLAPHMLTFTFPAPMAVTGISYLPRQDAYNEGTLTDYRIEASENGHDWKLVSDGSLPDDKTLKLLTLDLVALRLRIIWPSQPYASAAEIHPVFPASAPVRLTAQKSRSLIGWEDIMTTMQSKTAAEFFRLKIETLP